MRYLAASSWELEVLPERGGAVAALRHAGRPLLVSPDPTTQDAMGFASFALLPYVNRIARGRFGIADRCWTLPRNFGSHPHPLHGIGWKHPWQVTDSQKHCISMELQHTADATWPWSLHATQRIALDPDCARFELSLENRDAQPMPAGVGFHPAFASGPVTRLHADVMSVWLTGDDLPVTPAAPATLGSPLAGALVQRDTLVDHCFSGWARTLRIDNAGHHGEIPEVIVSASETLGFLQLYMPPGKDWFCAEPMSHMPDAINRAEDPRTTGLEFLDPGETMRAWMTIRVI